MIKAIIFDCFGVLVETTLEPFYAKYLKSSEAKVSKAELVLAASNRGEITYEQFVQELALLAGIDYAAARKFLDNNPRNEALIDYIRDNLKHSYKIGLLSNAAADWLDDLFTPEDLVLFDAFVLSYETGYAKPEARIYEITADKLGVRLDECVFIDDRPDYAEGATGVGMQAILYTNLEQLRRELTKILQ